MSVLSLSVMGSATSLHIEVIWLPDGRLVVGGIYLHFSISLTFSSMKVSTPFVMTTNQRYKLEVSGSVRAALVGGEPHHSHLMQAVREWARG